MFEIFHKTVMKFTLFLCHWIKYKYENKTVDHWWFQLLQTLTVCKVCVKCLLECVCVEAVRCCWRGVCVCVFVIDTGVLVHNNNTAKNLLMHVCSSSRITGPILMHWMISIFIYHDNIDMNFKDYHGTGTAVATIFLLSSILSVLMLYCETFVLLTEERYGWG